jgi:hypothetical protein
MLDGELLITTEHAEAYLSKRHPVALRQKERSCLVAWWLATNPQGQSEVLPEPRRTRNLF